MDIFLKILGTVCISVMMMIMCNFARSEEIPKWLGITGRICFVGYLIFFVHLAWGWI